MFQAELGAAFRAAGWWMIKWPDVPVRRMMRAEDPKLRFTPPKACDLVGCEPGAGRLVAIECKLLRARTFRVDARMVRQLETLRTLGALGARVALALNFRFLAQRPTRARVNRAFLVGFEDPAALETPGWREGGTWDFGVLRPGPVHGVLELRRIPGGWALPVDGPPDFPGPAVSAARPRHQDRSAA